MEQSTVSDGQATSCIMDWSSNSSIDLPFFRPDLCASIRLVDYTRYSKTLSCIDPRNCVLRA